MTAANVFILTLAVSVFTSLFLFQETSKFVIDEVQEKVDISVYFKYEVPEGDILDIREGVEAVPEVKEAKYISKEKALENFIARHQDDPTLMESLDEVGVNPFLASLNIKAYNPEQYGVIAQFFEETTFQNKIEKIDYHERQPVIERIFTLTSTVSRAVLILSVILAIVAVLVVFNTIRLAIYNFREEIKIQRLVGASNWFIRGPFVVQGAVSGVFGALISLLLFTLLTWCFDSTIEDIFPGLNLFNLFLTNFWIIFFFQLVIGVILGIISSLIAARKYLKV